MEETKLEKVNDRLYHEPYKDGKPFKWEKKLRFISITLTEIRTALTLDIERSETEIRLFEKERPPEEEDQTYSQELYWKITGTGNIDWRDRIGLIKKDGTRSARNELFETVEITLRAMPDSVKERGYGSLGHDDGTHSKRHRGPYVWVQLYVPKTEFDRVRDELVSGRLNRLALGVHLDTFESEVDSTLREPDMRMTAYIEEDSYTNRAYLSWLEASRSIKSERVPETVPDSPRELFETEGFHEQKLNYFGTWLIGIEQGFTQLGTGLYKAFWIFIIVYLAYKGLAWLLNWPA